MRLIVEGQEIRPYSSRDKTASDSIDFVRYHFALPPEWDGMTVTAQFTQGKRTYNRLLQNKTAILPSEILASGLPVKLSVFGVRPGDSIRATTMPYQFRVYPSGYVPGGVPSVPPTPDLYQQLLAEIKAAEEAAKNAAKRAEEAANRAEGGGGSGIHFTTDETLTLSDEYVLSVNRADEVEQDNTLPITSAAVYETVGNINALLASI